MSVADVHRFNSGGERPGADFRHGARGGVSLYGAGSHSEHESSTSSSKGLLRMIPCTQEDRMNCTVSAYIMMISPMHRAGYEWFSFLYAAQQDLSQRRLQPMADLLAHQRHTFA
jgi:hypothetical protein